MVKLPIYELLVSMTGIVDVVVDVPVVVTGVWAHLAGWSSLFSRLPISVDFLLQHILKAVMAVMASDLLVKTQDHPTQN